ncbi:MAG: MerR family transcriptional regulator [Clostridia bacterium]|nr:MerR family transcriptional regulator [Clostridia bacterium]
MNTQNLTDINEVCRRFGITSRTLRFYEEKGILTSTRDAFTRRRQYTAEQIEQLRQVMVLRSLGLSVKTIAELQKQDTTLRDAVNTRRAQIYAAVAAKEKELHLLNEALARMEAGEDLFTVMSSPEEPAGQAEPVSLYAIAQTCSEGVVTGDPTPLYRYFSRKMQDYMPLSAYEAMRMDTLLPLGKFTAYERLEADIEHPHILRHYIRYEKMGLIIRYVFYHGEIHGFWMTYYE